ncbi:hypothetical protein [Flavobacterium geliluteum]|uniref:Uncharacterized protein n=1 Tax=Flavobacterium geliluteum TaxID=2816120 RepID=A0A940XAJ4_9FLAO|nr:hypothetical protein [Flavobacterium geliluteum]MBP4139980.1 hypothetical protein [Flavobacterium geliluteum]
MEDYYNTKRLALILAVQAEIEGMKSANEDRKQQNHTMAHPSEDFQEKAMDLRNLAYAHNESL